LAVSAIVLYGFYANLDTVILAATRSTDEAGLYSGPYRLFLALNAVVVFAGYALLPVVARLRAAGAAPVVRALGRPLVAYGLACLGFAELFAGPVLRLLFGARFEAQGPVLVLLCLAVPWSAIGYPAGYAMIAADRSKDYLRGAATAGALNIVLNLALVPSLGTQGAAVATVAAFAAASVVWLARQRLLGTLRPILAVLVAASAGAVVHVLADGADTPVAVVTLVAAVAMAAWRPASRSSR
jgi:O-antigen/teichoic acid export membrane protein